MRGEQKAIEVYFDNAATSYPKPAAVGEAMLRYMKEIGASSGRGAYRKALQADRIIYESRTSLARLFNVKDVSRIFFSKALLTTGKETASSLLKTFA